MAEKMEKSDVLKKLEYPFDADFILSKKRSIRKQLLEEKNGCIKKKIAILVYRKLIKYPI